MGALNLLSPKALADFLVRRAARALPDSSRDRYEAEWLQIVAEIPRPLGKLCHAVTLWFGAGRIARAIRAAEPLELHRLGLTPVERRYKRAVDVVVATCALAILMPAIVVIAVAIKIESPGPILFRSARRGPNSRAFHLLKFRTMNTFWLDKLPVSSISRDPRITRIGSFARKTFLDEPPSLLNVLRGEMSMVGPRHYPAFSFDPLAEQRCKFGGLKPGLIALARNDGHPPELKDLDGLVEVTLSYLDNWTPWADFAIMLRALRRK